MKIDLDVKHQKMKLLPPFPGITQNTNFFTWKLTSLDEHMENSGGHKDLDEWYGTNRIISTDGDSYSSPSFYYSRINRCPGNLDGNSSFVHDMESRYVQERIEEWRRYKARVKRRGLLRSICAFDTNELRVVWCDLPYDDWWKNDYRLIKTKMMRLIRTFDRSKLKKTSTVLAYHQADWPTFIDPFPFPFFDRSLKQYRSDGWAAYLLGLNGAQMFYIGSERPKVMGQTIIDYSKTHE